MTVYGNKDATFHLIQMVDGRDEGDIEKEVAGIRKLTDADFCLKAIEVKDWNSDLSPWRAPAVFGREDFGDGAALTLAGILEYCGDPGKTYIIGGYSLAGLFALWAAYRTDIFKGVAAVSPSIWFPGFGEYMEENRIHADAVYLSLGDKENKTGNPVMATVADRIRAAHALLKDRGINTTLEWNPGNHFRDADIRMAKGFAWVMNR